MRLGCKLRVKGQRKEVSPKVTNHGLTGSYSDLFVCGLTSFSSMIFLEAMKQLDVSNFQIENYVQIAR